MTRSSTLINYIKSIAGAAFLLLFSLLMLNGNKATSQVVYNEGFNLAGPFPSSTLPYGWIQGKWGPGTSPYNVYDRLSSGVWPFASPVSAPAMLRYDSFLATTGEASFIATKKLDMRNGMPAAGAAFNFWMYRDGVSYQANTDRISVYINTIPDPTGATLVAENITSVTSINRSCSLTPSPTTCNAWNQYFFTVPNSFNGSSVYVIIIATSAFGNDIYIDDFSINTYPNTQIVAIPNVIAAVNQNSSTTAISATNQHIIGCKIQMDGATSPLALTAMQFNTNGSTNATGDILNAKLWYTGGTANWDPNTATQIGTYSNPGLITNFTMLTAGPYWTGPASFTGLDHGDNYFWLTYDIKATATSGDCVDAEWLSCTIGGTPYAPNPQTLTGCRLIDLIYCTPTYFVGTSWAGYQTNDYVKSVTLVGDNVPPPGISNNLNTIYAYAGTSCPGPFPTTCPFQSHTPDYELFSAVAGKTTSVTADGTTNYPITLQVGTYGSGNAIAAWIDYNKNGTFNNWFQSISINATGTAGTNTITLTGVSQHPGWRAGMNVSGLGIAPGATITTCSGTTVTLSANNVGPVSGAILFTTTDGEKIAQSQGLGALQTYSTTFIIPSTSGGFTNPGKSRLRVREVWINYNIDPCAAATYGEVEDYTVTIVPDCPGASGFTTWLGFTDDWTDPANWCPAIPAMVPFPIANVRIPGVASSLGYTYVDPVIRSGVQARATILRLEDNGIINIDAPSGSSLTVTDSVHIKTATSKIVINSSLASSAVVLNGALTQPTIAATATPLNNSLKSRSFLVYTPTELSTQGLITNDVITDIQILMDRKSTSPTYNNFAITYYYTNSAFVFVPGNPALVVPPQLSVPVTIRSSSPLSVASIPLNTFGTITIPLTTPFAWNGSANQLVIELSYDNATGSGIADQPRYTQTTGLRHYLSLIGAGVTGTYPANTFLPPTTTSLTAGAGVTTPITVGSTATLTVGMSVTGAGIAANTYITAILNGTQISINNATTASNTAINHTFGTNVFASAVMDYRPNLTFKYTRPYQKYPISVGGSWRNNGVPFGFSPGISRVTFNGTGAQSIEGVDSTTFYDMTVNNTGSGVTMNADIGITDSLTLTAGRLKLNLKLATLTNQALSALTYTNGDIQGETDIIANNVSPYGRIKWNMGSVVGLRIIPFINTGGTKIPFSYNILSGTHTPIFSTYNTTVANTNIPAPVSNINAYYGGTNNSANMIDRYYMIDNSLSTSPSADLTFRYASTERAGAASTIVRGQRWLTGSSAWEYPYIVSQSYGTTATVDSVKFTGFSSFSTNLWWAFVLDPNPLPISLLYFKATPLKDKVRLDWATATEINNDHFIVDRTLNNSDFSFIGRVESRGPSTNIQEYQTYDLAPVEGTQYYYLRQHDVDGKFESYGPVSATYSRDLFDIITATVSSSQDGITVAFNYNSTEPYSYKIMDMVGQVVAAKENNKAEPGANVIDIPATLSKGIYHIVLQNSSKIVSRKIFF